MSTVVASRELSTAADVIVGGLTVPVPQIAQSVVLHVAIPDFQPHLEMPLEEVVSDTLAGKVLLRATVDEEVAVVLIIAGGILGDQFQIEGVYFNTEAPFESARASFVASTLHAMFSLSSQVNMRVPELQLDLALKFNNPLSDISHMLRRRQIEYRIMVIERATGYEFMLPPDLTAEQVHDITLIYYAIVHRTFAWPVGSITVSFPATSEIHNYLKAANQSFTFRPQPYRQVLFGKEIMLGDGSMTIENKFIEDFDRVQEEMARDDGHQVTFVMRSMSGQGRYDFPNAPRLPDSPWEPMIRKLVDLESRLDTHLVELYHGLAAATLSGLSEQEKAAVTGRPELDESAFLIDD